MREIMYSNYGVSCEETKCDHHSYTVFLSENNLRQKTTFCHGHNLA